MADDPKTKEGRAEMLRKAEAERREAEYQARVWRQTADGIRDLQREAGDT